MLIKQKLTDVAVDVATQFLQDSFQKLRQFDLDQDGHKDVDQVIEILERCGAKAKELLTTTNAANIASGLEQIIAGATLIQKSFDQDKVTAFLNEASSASTKITQLAELSISYVKVHGRQ